MTTEATPKGMPTPEAPVSDGAAIDAAVKSAIAAAIADPSDTAPYAALAAPARRRVRDAIATKSRSAIASADPSDVDAAMASLATAKRFAAIVTTLESFKSTKSAPAVDPVSTLANRAATLRLAADLIDSGMAAPDGAEAIDFDGNARDLVTAVSWSDAIALATAKVGRGANRFDVADGIAIAFADKSVGDTMTVAAIRDAWHLVGGPSDGDGRIRARLTAPAGCTVPFIAVVPETADTPLSARLTAPAPAPARPDGSKV